MPQGRGSHEFRKTRTNLQYAYCLSLFNPLIKSAEVLCVCVCECERVYRMSVFLVVFHLWAYTLIARIESSAAGVARSETCRVYASFCRHIATNFRHLSLCTLSRVSDHVCLTCARQGSHEFTKTRRKNLQFADLFSLPPSYQTCGVLVYVYMMSVVLVVLHLRAYILIAQIGSTVGGIARLENVGFSLPF